MNQSNAEAVLVPPDFALQQLRSLVAELFTALKSTLEDERACAEHSLRRAAALLQAVDGRRVPEPKGGLAPWQARKVTAYIEANLDRPIRSADLAALVHLSPAHFSRTFRNSFGCAPLEYVTCRRIERAQGLMLSTDTPLAQIALDCGLADQAHFSRLFRRVVGESPSAWRRARARGPHARARGAHALHGGALGGGALGGGT